MPVRNEMHVVVCVQFVAYRPHLELTDEGHVLSLPYPLQPEQRMTRASSPPWNHGKDEPGY